MQRLAGVQGMFHVGQQQDEVRNSDLEAQSPRLQLQLALCDSAQDPGVGFHRGEKHCPDRGYFHRAPGRSKSKSRISADCLSLPLQNCGNHPLLSRESSNLSAALTSMTDRSNFFGSISH